MAIAQVQNKTVNSAGASVTSLAIVLTSTPTAGNIIALAAAVNSAAGLSGILLGDGTISWESFLPPVGGSNTGLLIAVGRVFAGASATITVLTSTTGGIAIAAAEYSGFTNPCFDRVIAATATGTAVASGATGTTSTATELWIGGISHRITSGTTFSAPTNSFAIVGQDKTTIAGTTDRSVALLERFVTSTGTANAGATAANSGIWVAGAVTVAEAAVGSSGGGIRLAGHGGLAG